jgi:hypothetical protein
MIKPAARPMNKPTIEKTSAEELLRIRIAKDRKYISSLLERKFICILAIYASPTNGMY